MHKFEATATDAILAKNVGVWGTPALGINAGKQMFCLPSESVALNVTTELLDIRDGKFRSRPPLVGEVVNTWSKNMLGTHTTGVECIALRGIGKDVLQEDERTLFGNPVVFHRDGGQPTGTRLNSLLGRNEHGSAQLLTWDFTNARLTYESYQLVKRSCTEPAFTTAVKFGWHDWPVPLPTVNEVFIVSGGLCVRSL